MNHLEQLVAEWLEFKGYFVRQAVRVGRRELGGFEGELDVVGFNPDTQHLIHVECSLDADSWENRKRRFSVKFERGRKHIRAMFRGLNLPDHVDQVAVLMFMGKVRPRDLEGARLMRTDELISEIGAELRSRPLASGIVPETFPLLRSVHIALGSKPATAGGTLIPFKPVS